MIPISNPFSFSLPLLPASPYTYVQIRAYPVPTNVSESQLRQRCRTIHFGPARPNKQKSALFTRKCVYCDKHVLMFIWSSDIKCLVCFDVDVIPIGHPFPVPLIYLTVCPLQLEVLNPDRPLVGFCLNCCLKCG